MLLLSVENLAHSYGERTLFKNVNLNIETGDKIGLIGINGTGKSTLLRHIAELDGGRDPETGEPGKIIPNGTCVIEYLPQDPPFDPDATVIEQIFRGDSPMMKLLRSYETVLDETALHPDDAAVQRKLLEVQQQMDQHFAWQLESEAKAVLNRLGITDFNQKMKTLSGGQRKRVALAGVLVRPSDLLILDEPTNHMDNETVAWLEVQLQKRKGALLMVTHDRYFFDRVINRTLELDNGTAYLYTANYSGFLQKRAERRELESAAARKLQNIYRRELAWISRGAEARRTKKKDRVERFAEIEAAAKEKVNRQELEITSAATRLGKTVVELEHLSCFYEGIEYIHDFSYILLRDDRVGIIGPNGVGKTTLMDIIAGCLQPDSGTVTIGQTVKIGYFSQQHEGLHMERTVLDEMLRVLTPGGLLLVNEMFQDGTFAFEQVAVLQGRLEGCQDDVIGKIMGVGDIDDRIVVDAVVPYGVGTDVGTAGGAEDALREGDHLGTLVIDIVLVEVFEGKSSILSGGESFDHKMSATVGT